jgi:hypothetical protein
VRSSRVMLSIRAGELESGQCCRVGGFSRRGYGWGWESRRRASLSFRPFPVWFWVAFEVYRVGGCAILREFVLVLVILGFSVEQHQRARFWIWGETVALGTSNCASVFVAKCLEFCSNFCLSASESSTAGHVYRVSCCFHKGGQV